MAATGSRDIVATDVTVPAHRVSPEVPPVLTAGLDAPCLVRIPVLPMLSLTAAMPAVMRPWWVSPGTTCRPIDASDVRHAPMSTVG